MQYNLEVVQELMSVFRGNEHAYGTYKKTGIDEARGKVKGTAYTIQSPPTIDLWLDHVNGKHAIGIIPINRDSVSYWAALDIDDYNVDHRNLLLKLHENNIPMLICRSKSNGAHCFMFSHDPIPAKRIRNLLKRIAIMIGVPGKEIYPAQDYLSENVNDMGNFLNMPYFGETRTCVKLMKDTLIDLKLPDFLSAVKEVRLEKEQFDDLYEKHCTDITETKDLKEDFKDAPPCLQYIDKRGLQEGERNTVLFNVGMYFKKRYGADAFQDHLFKYNDNCPYPLNTKEIVSIANSVAKEKYGRYMCKREPLNTHCNSALCIGKKHGVPVSENFPKLSSLEKLETDPAIYFMNIEGERISLFLDDIMTSMKFRKVVFAQLNRLLPNVKQQDWDTLLLELMKDLKINTPDSTMDYKLDLKEATVGYLSDRFNESKEVLKEYNGVYLDKQGTVWFRLSELKIFLVRKNIISKDMHIQKFSELVDEVFDRCGGLDSSRITMGTEQIRLRGLNASKIQLYTKGNKEKKYEDII